ncbi:MAG: ABC transporter substrate-binding protein [Deltaproteobacteria bacterium]|nr:ABC transporter substrate-binding protein [Deltaproteobacteria bacterium]MBI2990687.1 ABC transporter substrate-binding protein [Deltaproteobacteria bacterium]
MRLRTIALLIIPAIFALAPSPAPAQLTRVNVGYSAISADQLPAWVAKDSGIFEKNGLDVQLIFFTGGSTAILALVSGDVPITQVAGPGLVSSALAGSESVFVAAGITSLNYVLMGKPGLTKPEQLKGGSVAISRFGSATDSIARFALKAIGLTPGKDVTLVQVGSGPARLDAALTGKVSAAVINPPSNYIAEKRGLTVVVDVAKMGLVFQHTGAATTRKFIKEHPDTVRKYVKAHVEAVHRTWTDKEAGVRALAKYMGRGVDRDILEKSAQGILTESLLPKKQYPSLKGLQTVLDEIAGRDPRAKTAKPEQFVDFSFIKELDQSGYLDSLYKKK